MCGAGSDLCQELKEKSGYKYKMEIWIEKRIDIIIRLRNGLKRTCRVHTVRRGRVCLVLLSASDTASSQRRHCVVDAFLSPQARHVLSMLVLTFFSKTHSYSAGRDHGFYRQPLLGFISGIREKE